MNAIFEPDLPAGEATGIEIAPPQELKKRQKRHKHRKSKEEEDATVFNDASR